ncbi:glycosyltransferase family 2 protein [Aerosakkonemataceae cyanobacterium BLCC-F50]|uniref:Glycosyltransferase family 2 protein n=1 Tax=Floridaenema flaviceps BLCC-F50 TaxID=3153642 RepID=A0ABV4XP43_9CYAN
MDIAVVIPLFNGELWIRQTLEAVFSQSKLPTEVIVVDDGSEDRSPEIVKSFSGAKLLRNPQKGCQFARNFGFQQTTASLVTFLDQDDIWHPDHLQILSSLLEQYPESSAAVAKDCLFTSDRDLVFSPPTVKPELFDPWNMFPLNQIHAPASVLIRRSALEEIGGWTTQFWGGTDAYMWFRLSVCYPLVRNRSVTIGYRIQDKSTSHQWRLQKAQSFFATVMISSETVLADRIAVRPQEVDRLKKRLAVFRPMADVLKAVSNSDRTLLRSSALELESALSDESDQFTKLICGMLWWYLTPGLTLGNLAQNQGVIKIVQESWPRDVEKTTQLIPFHPRSSVSSKILLRYLLRNPWRLDLWGDFSNLLIARFAKSK